MTIFAIFGNQPSYNGSCWENLRHQEGSNVFFVNPDENFIAFCLFLQKFITFQIDIKDDMYRVSRAGLTNLEYYVLSVFLREYHKANEITLEYYQTGNLYDAFYNHTGNRSGRAYNGTHKRRFKNDVEFFKLIKNSKSNTLMNVTHD